MRDYDKIINRLWIFVIGVIIFVILLGILLGIFGSGINFSPENNVKVEVLEPENLSFISSVNLILVVVVITLFLLLIIFLIVLFLRKKDNGNVSGDIEKVDLKKEGEDAKRSEINKKKIPDFDLFGEKRMSEIRRQSSENFEEVV